jgi:hypothetical protein
MLGTWVSAVTRGLPRRTTVTTVKGAGAMSTEALLSLQMHMCILALFETEARPAVASHDAFESMRRWASFHGSGVHFYTGVCMPLKCSNVDLLVFLHLVVKSDRLNSKLAEFDLLASLSDEEALLVNKVGVHLLGLHSHEPLGTSIPSTRR